MVREAMSSSVSSLTFSEKLVGGNDFSEEPYISNPLFLGESYLRTLSKGRNF